MNFLKINSDDFFLSNYVQDVTGCGLPSWSSFCREKENFSAWKNMNMYANIEEYLNMPFVENLKSFS
jgi:hypothetical protein